MCFKALQCLHRAQDPCIDLLISPNAHGLSGKKQNLKRKRSGEGRREGMKMVRSSGEGPRVKLKSPGRAKQVYVQTN